MTGYRKKLIEVALPLDAINAASAREKSIRHGHPSTLHLWWARRPLAACRAVLFGQLVDDPSAWPDLFPTEADQDQERQRLFTLIEELVTWENSNNEKVINAARLEIARSVARNRKADGEGNQRDDQVLADGVPPEVVNVYLAEIAPPVHDPFAGGGSIPLEAQRLGLRAIASDLNPVAVLINKALIEIPPKFAGMPPVNPESRRKAGMRNWKGAQGLAEDVRYYGNWIREEAIKRIGHLYPDVVITPEMAEGRPDLEGLVGQRLPVLAWLWARTVTSPNPACKGAHVPLVSSFWLSKKKGKEAWVELAMDAEKNTWQFEVRRGIPTDPVSLGRGTRAGKAQDFLCVLSGAPVPREYIREEGKAGRLGERLLAAVVKTKQGRLYLPPKAEMEQVAGAAEAHESVCDARDTYLSGATPTRAMITGGVCSAYGLSTWGHLFTARQVLSLLVLSGLVAEAKEKSSRDAQEVFRGNHRDANNYGDAVATYLGIGVSKTADYNSSLVSWSYSRDQAAHVFTRQSLPMVWDHAEVNPFAGAAGDLSVTLKGTGRVLDGLNGYTESQALLEDAAAAAADAASTAIVNTDPPYFDNIGYAQLSDFFYIWLRRALQPVYPRIFQTMLAPKNAELVAIPFRHGGKAQAEAFFMQGMTNAMRAMASRTPDTSPVVIYYAFKQAEARGQGIASTGWETFLEAVLQSGLGVCGTWPVRTERGSRSVSIGTNALASSVVLVCRRCPPDAPAITRTDFRRLLRQELPDALKALQHGNIAPVDMAQASIGPGMAIFSRHSKVIEADGSAMPVRTALQMINEALDEYLAEQTGEFGPDTRFAVTWFETRGFEAGPFGEAETLAKARNVAVEGVQQAGILHSAAGKVRLLTRDELPDTWDPATDTRLTVWEATQHLIKRLENQGEQAAADLLARLGSKAEPARDLAYRLYTTCERKKWADEARAYNGLVVAWPELARLAAQTRTTTGTAQTDLFGE